MPHTCRWLSFIALSPPLCLLCCFLPVDIISCNSDKSCHYSGKELKMSKTERLIAMMMTINSKRHFTVGELAEEFSVSKRTVLRDLQALEEVGFPLYSEVGAAGGYHVLKERVLPPIAFSENEAKAIFFAYQSLQYYKDIPFKQENLSVLKKFLNNLPSDIQNSIAKMQDKVIFWVPDRHCSAPLLKEIFDIVTAGRYATIQYSSEYATSVRTIVPIGLYAMNGLWYCPAYCQKAKEVREFRVDRILKIIEAGEWNKEEDLAETAIPSLKEYLDHKEKGDDTRIIIRLTKLGVKRCEADFLLARGLKILPDGNGIIDLEIARSSLELVAECLVALGDHATVIASDELLELMRRKARELYAHYCREN